MIILAKYATQDLITFPMLKAGSTDFAEAADWTPVTGDVKYSLDGGAVLNTGNLPGDVGGTGSYIWALTLTSGELTGKQLTIQIRDAPTKAVIDNAIMIRTYGHANAYYPFDFEALTPATIAAVVNGAQAESYHVHGANATPAQLQYAIYAILVNALKEGTTMTVRKQDGSTAMVLTLNHPTNPTNVVRSA